MFLLFFRLHKLQETQDTFRQLGYNISQLRGWLAHVEFQLDMPLEYRHANMQQIRTKLVEQQVRNFWESIKSYAFTIN